MGNLVRLAVEDGLSFNQIATSEFFPLAFSSMGLQHKKAPSTVSKAVNNFFFYNVYSHKEKKIQCRYESPTEETREEHG